MNTLSLCMIVKDEELTLKRILEKAKIFADEIIIVDTGSTDSSDRIALSEGCKVYDFKWINDFSAARNYAFSLAKCDYVMWLDADDIVTTENAHKLNELKKDLLADVVMLPYHMGNPPSLIFNRERILKRSCNLRFRGRVHEAIEIKGNIIFKDIPIIHDKIKKGDPKRNLKIFEQMLKESGDLSGRDAFYYGSELYYNAMNDEAVFWLKKFLAGSGSYGDKGQAALFISRAEQDDQNKIAALNEGLHYAFSPDLLCEAGEIYFGKKNYVSAKRYFLTALAADEHITFHSPERSNYFPHIRLCCCYWQLGDKKRAELHNTKALQFKPNDKYALLNLKLFK